MKASTKLKIVGFTLLPIGIALIVLGCTVWSYHPFDDPFFDKMPQMGAVIPGIFLCFISLPILFMGFRPAMAKFGAKLQSETIDHAGEEMTQAHSKTTDTVTPSITKVASAVKEGFDPQKYCKHCGQSIDADSKFCKHCAKEQ